MYKLENRPDIDGLRAISVWGGLLYHGRVEFLEGGFLGVDVFFVISGYLITRIILSQALEGNFSFINFYKRRARRILPLIFFILLVSYPFALYLVIPNFFVDYSFSVISCLLYVSNLYFWSLGTGYNALETVEFQPFLHTWSLSVEEQFYVLYPLILIVILKYFKNYRGIILGLGFLVSLLLADWASHTHASINFYSLPTRGWELLAGGILANIELNRKGRSTSTFLNLICPSLGVFLILFSFVYFDDRMFMPSFLNLPVVIGTCLVIWFATKNNVMVKFLSSKIMVGTGLISYSLYIWHYPVYIFFKQIDLIYLIIITFVLSIFTYQYIEQPFRKKTDSKFFSIKTISLLFIIVFSLNSFTIYKDGFYNPAKYPKIINDLLFEKNFGQEILQKDIIINTNLNIKNKVNVFVTGDSHAVLLGKDMESNKELSKYNIVKQGGSGCYYIPGFDKFHMFKRKAEDYCDVAVQENRKKEILTKENSIVVLVGRLPVYLTGNKYDNGEGGIEQREWYRFRNKENISIKTGVQNGIRELLDNGVRVIIVYPIPPVGFDVMKKIFDAYVINDKNFDQFVSDNPFTTSYPNFSKWVSESNEILNSIDHPNLYRVIPEKMFCGTSIKKRCILHDENGIYYLDTNHLSKAGNKKIIDQIIDKIKLIEEKN